MSSIRPLSGITVIEIGHSVAAPYAGMILGELGAEVIKVENPKGGDACRGWGPPFTDGTATERVEVEYPLGHPRRRAEAEPLLREKLRTNLGAAGLEQHVELLLDDPALPKLRARELVAALST